MSAPFTDFWARYREEFGEEPEAEREAEEMRDAYDENDPKHPDLTERVLARAEYLEDR
jgi:hypothetical protein